MLRLRLFCKLGQQIIRKMYTFAINVFRSAKTANTEALFVWNQKQSKSV